MSYREDSFADRSQLANIITLMRILGVVFIFWVTPFRSVFSQLWIIVLFIVVCATDYLDGWVARRFNIVSDTGKVLDPLADKILVLLFLPLLEMKAISSFPVFIILAREFAIMALRVVSAKKGHIISANLSGKIKTAITFPVCGILLARIKVPLGHKIPFYLYPLRQVQLWVLSWPFWVVKGLITLTVVVTIWSFLDYLAKFIWQFLLEKANGDVSKAKYSLKKLIPNAISTGNLLIGVFAVVSAYQDHLSRAVMLVLISIFLDGIDGSVARKLQVESELGAKLDSRADFVCFGIAPAVIIWLVFSESTLAYSPLIGLALGFFYYGCVHYRLKRFSATGGHSALFQGIPSPVGASLIVLASVSNQLSQPFIFLFIVIASSLLMISKIPYVHNQAIKQTFLRFFQKPSFIVFILTILSLSHIIPVLSDYTAVFAHLFLGCVGLYIISPLFIKNPSDLT